MSLDSEGLGLMGKYGFEVSLSVSFLNEVKDSLGGGGGACLGVPQVEDVEVEDVIGGGLGLEGLENACGLLIQSFPQDVVEEEGLYQVDRILYQLFTVLLIQEGVKNAQVSHMFLLREVGVRKAC